MTAGRTNHTAFAAPALVPIDMVLHCPACGRRAHLSNPPELIEIVGQILDAGHLNTEDLARLRDAWERAQP
jgi:hypothetical protein